MCTGRPPFRAETTFGVLRRIRETPPRPIREINADIPDWLERIVLKLLSKDASDRIATATDVATLLEQCLAHVQQPTTVELPVVGWALLPVSESVPHKESGKSAQPTARWLVVAAFIAISLGVFFSRPNPTSTTNTPTSSPTEPSSLDPLLQWDATQAELDTTASVVNDLEETSQRDLEASSQPDVK